MLLTLLSGPRWKAQPILGFPLVLGTPWNLPLSIETGSAC